jgi:O-succinylbenzoate synthase
MRIIEMELVSPFETSFGVEEVRPAIIISAKSEGMTGWGECVAGAGPWYSYETIETAQHVLSKYLIPWLLNSELEGIRDVRNLWAPVRGHLMAKAGLEAALWDLFAQSKQMSVSKLLGGTKESVQSGVSIGIQEDIPSLIESIAGYIDEGYPRIKLKIKPGWDEEILAAVRTDFPKITLMADANAAYSLEDAELFKRLDQYQLLMIEQPFSYEDLFDHSELQKRISTPICLDESIKTSTHVRQAHALGSCEIINIKPGRVGGLSFATEIHDYCRENGIPVWCGGMLETGIGRAHNVALASLPGFVLPNDLSASSRYYVQDLIEPDFALEKDGTLCVPTGNGIGAEVQLDRLDKVTINSEVFSNEPN